MKTILALTLLISLSLFKGEYSSSSDITSELNILIIKSCPDNNESAEKELKTYLAKEATIDNLSNSFEMNIDHTWHNRIQALDVKDDQIECEKLIERFEWIKNDTEYSYSIYKVIDSYFVVRFLLTEKSKYEFKSITIINSELEVVAVAIDFG